MIERQLKLLDRVDKGITTVSPYYWQGLVYWLDLVSSLRRDKLPKRFQESEIYFDRVVTTLCKHWRSKARDVKYKWKDEQKSNTEEEDDSILAISPDDDERTVPTSNRAPLQIKEWENLDDNDSRITNMDQMICVFEDLVCEERKIFCETTLRAEQHLEEKGSSEGNEMFFNLDGLEPGKTFMLKEHLEGQTSSNSFLGEGGGERIFGKPAKNLVELVFWTKHRAGNMFWGDQQKNLEGTYGLSYYSFSCF